MITIYYLSQICYIFLSGFYNFSIIIISGEWNVINCSRYKVIYNIMWKQFVFRCEDLNWSTNDTPTTLHYSIAYRDCVEIRSLHNFLLSLLPGTGPNKLFAMMFRWLFGILVTWIRCCVIVSIFRHEWFLICNIRCVGD